MRQAGHLDLGQADQILQITDIIAAAVSTEEDAADHNDADQAQDDQEEANEENEQAEIIFLVSKEILW